MAFLTPPNPHDKELAGFSWQEWFRQLWSILKTVENRSGHLYVTNSARHAINTCSGVQTATSTVVNTATETAIYTYAFAANEIDLDQHIVAKISGVISNASAADDYTIRFKFNGATIHTLARVGGNVTNAGFRAIYELTARTIGASGTFVDFAQLQEASISFSSSDVATHAIDTTAINTFEITVQWAASKAGNTISCTQGNIAFYH